VGPVFFYANPLSLTDSPRLYKGVNNTPVEVSFVPIEDGAVLIER
jgi:hypothetical protein